VEVLSRNVSLTVSLTSYQVTLIEGWAAIYGLTFSQALREFIDKGEAHERERIAREEQENAKQTTFEGADRPSEN